MAVALHVYIVDPVTGKVPVEHVFYGATEAEADQHRLAHLAGCNFFAKAEADDLAHPTAPRVFETIEKISEADVPTADDFEDEDDGEDEEEGAEGEEAEP